MDKQFHNEFLWKCGLIRDRLVDSLRLFPSVDEEMRFSANHKWSLLSNTVGAIDYISASVFFFPVNR